MNEAYRAKYHLKHQLLHSWQLVVPENVDKGNKNPVLAAIAGKCFEAPVPELFSKILDGEGLKK